jgi:hypothetical protein
MYLAPPLHTDVNRLIQVTAYVRSRGTRPWPQLSTATSADEVHGVVLWLSALVTAARLGSPLSSHKPAGGVA